MRAAGVLTLLEAGVQPRERGPGPHRWLLQPHREDLPSGWCLLRGALRRRGGSYDAQLHLDFGGGRSHRIPVATSGTGAVNEVLWLPNGVRRLELVLHGDTGDYEFGGWSLRPVSPLQRRWRMLLRVLPQLLRQPPDKRARLGLTLPRLLVDLDGSYESATRLRAHAPPPPYEEWLHRFDTLSEADRRAIEADVQRWERPPSFQVVLAEDGDREAVDRTLRSLQGQLFGRFQCTRVNGPPDLAELNARLAAAGPGDFLVLLRAGDLLAPHALYAFAAAAVADPAAVVIYGDEDVLDAAGRRGDPCFKPEWSWAHARSTRFPGDAVALDACTLARAGGLGPADCAYGCYDAVLRCLDAGSADPRVRHVPGILLHRPASRAPDAQADGWAMDAVRAHLGRRGEAAQVESAGSGRWRVRYPLPAESPLVSIVVPTRDALALTRRCLETVRARTAYPRFEVLLVDNQSRDPAALRWMQEQQACGAIRLLSHDGPFNFSAINNQAVREARGELVCLLNNDTEVIEGGWLEEMVSQLLQPGVEVVGAKLLYPDGRVQHAGDLVGVGGVANHAHAWLPADDPGYCGRALVAQDYSAVTGACLLTRRSTYLALGGLDERHLPVAFNDVDYCLRVREAGGRVVWTPHAVLVHHESVSRGRDLTWAQKRRARGEADYMRRRWRAVLQRDPFYHPNLSMERPDFSLSHAPLALRPWQR